MSGRIASFVLAVLIVVGGLLPSQLVSYAMAQTVVVIRSADHEGFSRAVFDFDTLVPYQLSEDGTSIRIEFSGDFSFDLLGLRQLKNVTRALSERQDGASVAVIAVPEGARVRHFRDFTRIVVDVIDSPLDAPASEPLAADQEVADQPVAEAPVIAEPVEAEPSTQIPASDIDPAADVASSAVSDPQPDVAIGAPQPQEPFTPRGDQGILPVTTIVQSDQQSLYFNWDYPVAAAVFKRSGVLWVVFDEPATADVGTLQPYLNGIFTGVEQDRNSDSLVLRFTMSADQPVKVDRRDNQWRVRVGGISTGGSSPIVLAKQDTLSDGFRMFVPLEEPGSYLQIEDPLVGDTLDVVPVLASDYRVTLNRNFVQFQVMESAQGFVMTRMSDQILISHYVNGVAIGSANQLFVSESRLENRFAAAQADNLHPQKLLNFRAWKLGPLEDFTRNKHELQRALSDADDVDRNIRRWDLARFYLAHNFSQESRAILSLMQEEDSELIKDAKFKAVLGVAELRLLNFERAKELLASPELNAEPDVFLWRGLVEEAQGNYQQAMASFERGHNHVEAYEDAVGAVFRLAHLRAVLKEGRYDDANWELARLHRMNLIPRQAAELNYLEGNLLENLGEFDEAMAFYAAVDENKNRHAYALANYAMIKGELEKRVLSVEEAIDRLEQLRFAWRGDDFELDILTHLSEVYLNDGQYRRALETMRGTAILAPESEYARKLTKSMVDLFRTLYMEGQSERMPPVSALALYYDFRELTPLGNEGDQMIRRLSERLVAVDLLDQAADLLDHQVRFRLEGVPQAIIANRLAKVYILDNKPEKAAEILRLTRNIKVPDDIEKERKLVDARVLTELEKYEQAEVTIEGLTGAEAMLLRSDIYWGDQNWRKTTQIVEELLGGRWQSPETMDARERQYLMRMVISLSMMGDRAGLDTVRGQYAEHMKTGRFANAFDLITSKELKGSSGIRELVKVTASVNELKSFMDAYRSEFMSGAERG